MSDCSPELLALLGAGNCTRFILHSVLSCWKHMGPAQGPKYINWVLPYIPLPIVTDQGRRWFARDSFFLFLYHYVIERLCVFSSQGT